ncbi:hypothetical protein GCM10023107_52810 [Actinoplanes octamycinicus]|nr:hypothetical protein Aoc01nite_48380 [Actinoplanes octamycinicus]
MRTVTSAAETGTGPQGNAGRATAAPFRSGGQGRGDGRGRAAVMVAVVRRLTATATGADAAAVMVAVVRRLTATATATAAAATVGAAVMHGHESPASRQRRTSRDHNGGRAGRGVVAG